MKDHPNLRICSQLAGLALLLIPLPSLAQRANPLAYDEPEWQWLDNRDPDSPRPSPNASVGLQIGSTRVLVAYGSPAVKGRQIFGGLVPYNQIWRTGANEATTITFNGDLLVGGELVPAGTYSLFTVPNPDQWTMVLDRNNNQWGANSRNSEDEALRITVRAGEAEYRERFAISFDDIDTEKFSASMVLHWDRTRVSVPLAEPD